MPKVVNIWCPVRNAFDERSMKPYRQPQESISAANASCWNQKSWSFRIERGWVERYVHTVDERQYCNHHISAFWHKIRRLGFPNFTRIPELDEPIQPLFKWTKADFISDFIVFHINYNNPCYSRIRCVSNNVAIGIDFLRLCIRCWPISGWNQLTGSDYVWCNRPARPWLYLCSSIQRCNYQLTTVEHSFNGW